MSSASYFAHATAFFVAFAIVLTIRVHVHRTNARRDQHQSDREAASHRAGSVFHTSTNASVSEIDHA